MNQGTNLILQKCSNPLSNFQVQLLSGAQFANFIFQKCSKRDIFFAILNCKWSSRDSPVRFLRTTFPDRGAELRRPRELEFTGKKYRSVESVFVFFAREFTRFQVVTSQLLDDEWLT